MTTPEQRIYNGNRAREVLENESFIQAFSDIEQEVIEQWKNSPARDEAGRERLWTYLMLMQKFRTQLQTTLETGKLAELDLNHKRSLMDKVKAGLSSWSE